MKKAAERRGYALVIVLLFIAILLSLSSMLYRQLGAALRIESVRSAQVARDEGSLRALARGLALLQTGTPPSSPYKCGLMIETSAGPRDYTVTFSADDDTNWSINAVPTQQNDIVDPMPNTFAVP
jgi:hypothetical protein